MAQPIPQGYFAHNTEVLGYHDLNGKPAFKLAMQEMNDRWYLYLAHLWHQGWSIFDVTDPTAPQFVAFLPGPENTWTIQIQVADGKMITALERIAPGWGARVLKSVGNYGEMYERNLGAASPLKIERGLNRLWTQGGLMYAPPLR